MFWGVVCYVVMIFLVVGGFIIIVILMSIVGMMFEVNEFESVLGLLYLIVGWIELVGWWGVL